MFVDSESADIASYRAIINISFCRHPVHSQRPPFSDISHYLSMSSDLLLEWREEDKAGVDSRARELGAPLTEAVDLYKDLQDVYLQLEDTIY